MRDLHFAYRVEGITDTDSLIKEDQVPDSLKIQNEMLSNNNETDSQKNGEEYPDSKTKGSIEQNSTRKDDEDEHRSEEDGKDTGLPKEDEKDINLPREDEKDADLLKEDEKQTHSAHKKVNSSKKDVECSISSKKGEEEMKASEDHAKVSGSSKKDKNEIEPAKEDGEETKTPTTDGDNSTSMNKTVVRAIATVSVVTATAVIAAPVLLTAAGFSAGGIAAGSLAAVWQSYIGSVAVGSTFAFLQGAGASGAFTLEAANFGIASATPVAGACYGLWNRMCVKAKGVHDSSAKTAKDFGQMPGTSTEEERKEQLMKENGGLDSAENSRDATGSPDLLQGKKDDEDRDNYENEKLDEAMKTKKC